MAVPKLIKKGRVSARSKVSCQFSLSSRDRFEDSILRKYVRSTVDRQLQSGAPVARYDVKSRRVYMEYPNGQHVHPPEA